MAADQHKKRLSAANVFGHGSREQYRAKKKHFASSQFDLNWTLNSHIPCKWDNNEKGAIAKGEQIGLSKRDLLPFIASDPHHNNNLADVIAVPKDAFKLDDLSVVLSYEVWQSILTDRERSYLMHFLPKGLSPDLVVQGLLAGENLHFGNPFLKWCSSLLTGELHPDEVLHYEQTFRGNKKAYYSELQRYHDNIIKNLQKLKDRCVSAKDPEAEIEKMMWRSRKQPGKNMMLVCNEVRSCNREYNVTSGDKACGSDNQNPTKTELPRSSKDVGKNKDGRPVGCSDVMKVASKSKKRENLQTVNVNHGDGTKYMSYVKISKSQHELLRSMKQYGNSIQSKALSRIFGDLNNFNVKPFVMFEEEEQRRIQEYWSNIAEKDVPLAFSNWGRIQSERGQIMKSLCLEIEGKLKHLMEEEETEHSNGAHYCQKESVQSDDTEKTQEDEASSHGSFLDDDQESNPSFAEEQASLQMPSLDVKQQNNPTDLNEENHLSPKSRDTCSVNPQCHVTGEASEESLNMSACPEKKSSVDVVVNKEVLYSSARDAWPAIAGLGSSCCPSAMDYACCSEMPPKHSQAVEDQTAQLMDLESGIPEENTSKSLLPQQTDELPFFSSYQNDVRHELLHTVVKCDDYQEELKKTALGFHPTTSILMDCSQFSGHSQEPLHPSFPLEPRHRASSDFYLHPNIQGNMYPGSSRYSIPRPEHFTSISMREWSSPPPRFSTPMQSLLSSTVELSSHNWFPVEDRAQGEWSSSEILPTPSLGSGSGGDQSLYSVLTQCRVLHPSVPAFNSVGSTNKFMPTGNLAEDLGFGIPRRSNLLSQPVAASPLDYFSGHDVATSTFRASSMGWMNLPHQSSALHDSSGKPFPKSWNQ